MLTAERIRIRLRYDPETGIFIWNKRTDGPKWWNAKFSEKQAGNLNSLGYRTIYIEGRAYPSHWVAWIYMTGKWPAGFLDHRDGNRANNSWGNLRLASCAQNNANKKLNINNKVGLKGVRAKGKRFEARITNFKGGSLRLGMFDSAEDAHAAYVREAARLFGEFARPK